ncbi:MAG: penicillin-binding protein 2 [Candidatus Spechtbacterales bacterium]|nr:penicillin-binding protein 2 [Candidatus Spechtbacterales bacterium]
MAKRKKRKSNAKHSDKNLRITALFLILMLPALGIVARLYYLQIQQGDYYSALAVGQSVDVKSSPPPRGDIYFQDKAGSAKYIAAINREVPLVYADPGEVSDPIHTLSRLEEVIKFEKDEMNTVESRLQNKTSSYALIARHLEEEQAQRIIEMNLEGVYVKNELVRHYPAEETASHVLGFLGFSGNKRAGQYGVEKYNDDILSGKNIKGFSINSIFSGSADSAADIELTIDYGAQFAVEKELKELQERWDPDSISALFMDPKTGAIIAMAHIPGFDPNEYYKTEDVSHFSNPLVQSRFEFGSVFKPITMAAAIDSGAVLPGTQYEDTGKVEIGSYTIRNSDGEKHGIQTMTQVLEKSLNTGVIFAEEKMGKKKFKEYLEAFELNELTKVDLPGEISGDMNNVLNTTRDINYATASFGQGLSFSTVRFLSSIAAIANNGTIMQPYIVNKIVQNGEEIETKPQEVSTPISKTTASRVTAMMVSVVENGFGAKAGVPGYSVAGKTGTAQIPKEDGPGYSDRTLQSFIGFAPAYNPKFIGIIQMENPKGIRFASDSVAPAFGDISSFLLQYYNIPPQ